MKRGIFINLGIIFGLLFLAALPWLFIALASWLAGLSGCELSVAQAGGDCSGLSGLAFAAGLFGTVTTPLVLVGLGVYLLAVTVISIVSLLNSRLNNRLASPKARGMLLSTGALVLVGVLAGGGWQLINWYQVSAISACRSLPGTLNLSAQNGPLALTVKLADAAGTPAEAALVTVRPDGSGLQLVARLPGSQDPAWSPDGSQIALITRPPETQGYQLVLLPLAGEPGEPLLSESGQLHSPAWLPDAGGLLVERPAVPSNNPNYEIFHINLDGSALQPIGSSPAYDGAPVLSPDGQQVAFVSRRNGEDDIYIMDVDGSNVRRLTRNPGVDTHPAWSPDGRWIVFASNRDSRDWLNNYNLYVMAVDGTNQCRLTGGEDSEWLPVWSPDGNWIAYVSLLERRVYLAGPDGSQQHALDLEIEVTDITGLDWARQP